MRLLKLIILILLLFTFISTCEPRITAVGTYLNILREKKKKEAELRRKESEFNKKNSKRN